MKKRHNWSPSTRYLVLALVLILLAVWAWQMREIFQPLMLAALIAYFLSPAVSFLSARARLERRLAANLVYFAALALFITLPVTVLPALFDEFQSLINDLNRALDDLQVYLSEPRRVGNLSFYLGSLLPALRAPVSGVIVPEPEDALRLLETTSRNFLWFLVVVVGAYYLVTDWDRLREWFIRLAPESEQPDLRRLYERIRAIWVGYLRGQIRLIVILATIYSLAWVAIGLPGAVILGLLAGLLNLLPEVGPFAAALLATVIALIEGSTYLPLSNLWFAALTLGVYLLLNNFKTIWLQPRILGHSVLLHEGVVFVAIIAAVVLQGVLGVLIVVPLLATFGVIGGYLRRKLLGLPPFEGGEDDGGRMIK